MPILKIIEPKSNFAVKGCICKYLGLFEIDIFSLQNRLDVMNNYKIKHIVNSCSKEAPPPPISTLFGITLTFPLIGFNKYWLESLDLYYYWCLI